MTREEMNKEMKRNELVAILQRWQAKGYGNMPVIDAHMGMPLERDDVVNEAVHYDYRTGDETPVLRIG